MAWGMMVRLGSVGMVSYCRFGDRHGKSSSYCTSCWCERAAEIGISLGPIFC